MAKEDIENINNMNTHLEDISSSLMILHSCLSDKDIDLFRAGVVWRTLDDILMEAKKTLHKMKENVSVPV